MDLRIATIAERPASRFSSSTVPSCCGPWLVVSVGQLATGDRRPSGTISRQHSYQPGIERTEQVRDSRR
jgi:hypothetical protein